MSSDVRHALDVPPDTIVLVRRSIPHVLSRSAANLVVPFAGLAIAALAVPGVSLWTWLLIFGVTVVMSLAPLRLR